MSDQYDILESAVRDIFYRALWSHKVQEKQADIYHLIYTILMWLSIVFSAITTAGVFSVIFKDETWIKIVSTIVAFITLVISTYLKTFDVPGLIKTHKETANHLLALRNESCALIALIKTKNRTVEELENMYLNLLHKANEIYRSAPQTTTIALNEADKALHEKRDNSFLDKEIDSYLPDKLRKGAAE